MVKRKKSVPAYAWIMSIMILVVLVVLVFGITPQASVTSETSNNDVTVSEGVTLDGSGCSNTGLTNVKLDLFNSVNTTGSEGVDEIVYIFNKDSGVLVATINDTTSPSSTSLACPANFIAKAISTSGASGDTSFIDSVAGDATIVDGNLEFTTKVAVLDLRANIEQHASLNCRAKDLILDDFMYDSSDASASDYETDGVTFTSTTSNATASTETDGFDIELQCRAVESDTDYNDRGVLVLLEMPTTSWEVPTVSINGQSLSAITLEGSEKDAYVDYEYAFLIPSDVNMEDGANGFSVRVATSLRSGITSVNNDPQIDFAPRGAHLATNGQDVNSNVAVTDASTPAQIHTLYDVTVDFT